MKDLIKMLAQKLMESNDDNDEEEDKLEQLQKTRPKMKSKEMQDLVDKKRKAIILLMMKNKRK